MASFSDVDLDRLDWQLMQNGAITLYFQNAVLEAELAWLRQEGYTIHTIDCRDVAAFQRQMSLVLRFREQFGYEPWDGNLNALNDAFRYLDTDIGTGLVLCFLRYDALKTLEPEFADAILDIIELNSRRALLLGLRLLALVQSDDPEIQFPPLGARSAMWNHREWLNSARGL